MAVIQHLRQWMANGMAADLDGDGGVGVAPELVPFPSVMSVKRVNYVLCHAVARQFIVRKDQDVVH